MAQEGDRGRTMEDWELEEELMGDLDGGGGEDGAASYLTVLREQVPATVLVKMTSAPATLSTDVEEQHPQPLTPGGMDLSVSMAGAPVARHNSLPTPPPALHHPQHLAEGQGLGRLQQQTQPQQRQAQQQQAQQKTEKTRRAPKPVSKLNRSTKASLSRRLADARKADINKRIQTAEQEKQARLAAATEHHRLYDGRYMAGWLYKRTKHYWSKKWVVVKASCLAWYRLDSSTVPRGVLLYHKAMHVQQVSQFEFEIRSHGRQVSFRIADQGRERKSVGDWISAIGAAMDSCIYTTEQPYMSFAPLRYNNFMTWFVDGRDMFQSLTLAMQRAKKEVFVTAWWLAPHLFLMRAATDGRQAEGSILDVRALLLSTAERGVVIHILHYREVALALPHNSAFTEESLRHENIHIMRHPWKTNLSTQYWSHHEKIWVIDRTVAFIGGLDVTFGRFDDCHHQISPSDHCVGLDYHNPRIRDFSDCDKPHRDILDRSSEPRMPWHDVHCAMVGPSVADVARHFIQRWNFSRHGGLLKFSVPELIPASVECRIWPGVLKSIHGIGSEVNTAPIMEGSHLDSEASPLTFDHLNAIGQQYGLARSSFCMCQMVRSVGPWSAGCPRESSVYEAYVAAIRGARHFVYIEQQFFVSAPIDDDAIKAAKERIRAAQDGSAGIQKPEPTTTEPSSAVPRASNAHVLGVEAQECIGVSETVTVDSGPRAALAEPTDPAKRDPTSSELSSTSPVHEHGPRTASSGQPGFGSIHEQLSLSVDDDPDRQAQERRLQRAEGSVRGALGNGWSAPPPTISQQSVHYGSVASAATAIVVETPQTPVLARPAFPDSHVIDAFDGLGASDDDDNDCDEDDDDDDDEDDGDGGGGGDDFAKDDDDANDPMVFVGDGDSTNVRGGRGRGATKSPLPSAASDSLGPPVETPPEVSPVTLLSTDVEEPQAREIPAAVAAASANYSALGDVASPHTLSPTTGRKRRESADSTDPDAPDSCAVRNGVARAIFWRVVQAIEKDETFRVYIVLPCIPGLEGDPSNSNSIRAVMRTQMAAIRSLVSAVQQVCSKGYTVDDFITFCTLRNHGRMPNGRLEQQEVYVHSKLIIVDDRKVVIGSANMNDRSLLGYRDSEVALVIRDQAFIDSVMDGMPQKVGRFAHSLRMHLWAEHLGILQEHVMPLHGHRGDVAPAENNTVDEVESEPGTTANAEDGGGNSISPDPQATQRTRAQLTLERIRDPVCDSSYHGVWRKTATYNARVYEHCFPNVPRNSYRRLRDFPVGEAANSQLNVLPMRREGELPHSYAGGGVTESSGQASEQGRSISAPTLFRRERQRAADDDSENGSGSGSGNENGSKSEDESDAEHREESTRRKEANDNGDPCTEATSEGGTEEAPQREKEHRRSKKHGDGDEDEGVRVGEGDDVARSETASNGKGGEAHEWVAVVREEQDQDQDQDQDQVQEKEEEEDDNDEVQESEDLNEQRRRAQLAEALAYSSLLPTIQGHLCAFPTEFLAEEDLQINLSLEYLIPFKVFL